MSDSIIHFSEVLGNSQKLDGGSMFGNAPRTVWEKWCPPDELGRIDLNCRALLLKINNTHILLETGIGTFFEPKLAERYGIQNYNTHKLVESLKKLNLTPNDIDWIILSHLHFDHAGGLLPSYEESLRGNNDIIFNRAQFVVGKEAFRRATEPHFRDKASFIPGLTEKLINTNRLHLVDSDLSPIYPNHIKFIYSHGHTPGHLHTLINSEKQKLFFAGDLIPGMAWVHLPITMGYDRYAEKVIDEKQAIYNMATEENWLIFYTHDSRVACSQIHLNEKKQYVGFNAIEHPTNIQLL